MGQIAYQTATAFVPITRPDTVKSCLCPTCAETGDNCSHPTPQQQHPVCWVSAELLASPWHCVFGTAALAQVDSRVDTAQLGKKQTSGRACEQRCCPRGALFSLQLGFDVVISVQTGASAQAVWVLPGLVDLGSLEQRMGKTRERFPPQKE